MRINLDSLKDGIMGLTKETGGFMLQACMVCLDNQGHQSDVDFKLSGIQQVNIKLNWEQEVSQRIRRNWSDLQEATEYGAVALAIVCAEQFSSYDTVERSTKGTGFDYWLGEEDEWGVFQRKARLEVSGILMETASNTVTKRVREKLNQVKVADEEELEIHVFVADFKTPKGRYIIE